MKTRQAWLTGCAALAAAPALFEARIAGAQAVPIKIAAGQIDAQAQAYYAQDQGYFRDRGLDTSITTFHNGVGAAAVAGHDAQIGVSSVLQIAQARALIDRAGGDTSTVKLVEIPPSATVKALSQGRIAASNVEDPERSTALRSALILQKYLGVTGTPSAQRFATAMRVADFQPILDSGAHYNLIPATSAATLVWDGR